MKLDLHYTDPRLVALYDTDNPRGADTDFYLQLAQEIQAQTIVDLGCGTGLLTRELAIEGRRVMGVEPSASMLAYARQQHGADLVQWIEGDASVLGQAEADLALMTGNVAQVFLEDTDWTATLRFLHTALKPNGCLAFESRNPDAKAWKHWNQKTTHERIQSPYGAMECWLELVSVDSGRVQFQAHNVFNNTGEDLVVNSELRFRSLEEITNSLQEIGFRVEQVYGGWQRQPLTTSSQAMVFVARRDATER
jgi:SAM-dependent methyltransferase